MFNKYVPAASVLSMANNDGNSIFRTATSGSAGNYSLTNAGAPAPNPAPAPAPADNFGLPDQAAAGFQAMLSKFNNDAIQVAAKLYDDNYQQREQIRALQAKQPEGSITLTVDQAKDWAIYQALNMKASDVKKAVESAATLEQQNRELSALETLRTVAEIGIDGSKLDVDVLADQLKLKFPEAKFTFREDTVKAQDGTESKVKVALIQKTDKDAVEEFSKFANDNLSKYLPALKVSNAETSGSAPVVPGNTGDPAPHNSATSFFDQIRKETEDRNKIENPISSLDARFGRSES